VKKQRRRYLRVREVNPVRIQRRWIYVLLVLLLLAAAASLLIFTGGCNGGGT
jgi:hypothetical protein